MVVLRFNVCNKCFIVVITFIIHVLNILRGTSDRQKAERPVSQPKKKHIYLFIVLHVCVTEPEFRPAQDR